VRAAAGPLNRLEWNAVWQRELHTHVRSPAGRLGQLDPSRQSLDHRQAHAFELALVALLVGPGLFMQVGAGLLMRVGADADAAIAYRHADRSLQQTDLDLERALGALVGVHHDVIARLRDRRVQVVRLDRVKTDTRRQAAQCLADQEHVLRAAREAQSNIRRVLVHPPAVDAIPPQP
jgi:hypothetical protein